MLFGGFAFYYIYTCGVFGFTCLATISWVSWCLCCTCFDVGFCMVLLLLIYISAFLLFVCFSVVLFGFAWLINFYRFTCTCCLPLCASVAFVIVLVYVLVWDVVWLLWVLMIGYVHYADWCCWLRWFVVFAFVLVWFIWLFTWFSVLMVSLFVGLMLVLWVLLVYVVYLPFGVGILLLVVLLCRWLCVFGFMVVCGLLFGLFAFVLLFGFAFCTPFWVFDWKRFGISLWALVCCLIFLYFAMYILDLV